MSVFSGRSGPDDYRATAGRAMLSDVSSDTDYLPAAIVDWAETYSWLLDDIASIWLSTGESPRRADLQQTLMAAGHDVYLAGVLHDMPTPLGWVESQDQRVVISLFGLRAAPCMQQTLTGLGPLVALAVARYRQSGSRASISVGDVERDFAVDGRGAAALADRLFTELPFLGSQVPGDSTGGGEAREIREDIARYAGVHTTDEYLEIRAGEIRGHPQFGWGRWEPDRREPAFVAVVPAAPRASQTRSPARRLINHPWVVGIGTVVVGGVILALILGHG
jgi:hypothetical protein